jgi:hypothetical protein
MRYTKYILSDKFVDINALQTEKILFKLPMILITIPVALVGVMTILGLLPMTVTVDGVRRTKCALIHFKRGGYKIHYFEKFRYNNSKLITIFEKSHYEGSLGNINSGRK